ncbi:uncharacterized protein [Phyllobates terribilis]|uniref:uncharacterized protein n=1 Tax=Phyllobates terribilis TaxID=111132 RepID=UPI003CCB16F7
MHPYITNCMKRSEPNSKNFMEKIRSYNSENAFASMGAQIDQSINRRSGLSVTESMGKFTMQHLGCTLTKVNHQHTPSYIFWIWHNPANSGCIRNIMENLQRILEAINPFSREYKNMFQFEQEEMLKANLENRTPIEYSMTFVREKVNTMHPGRINAPTARGEIAAIFHSTDGAPPENHDITIHPKRKLTHQFLVDAYCKTEANRLNWVRKNQSTVRTEEYDVHHQFVTNHRFMNIKILSGKKVILPSTFQGSPRNIAQNYQDAMAMVRKYGKPYLFITVTCNPKWREIRENLLPSQQPCDRPDLVARVFNMKLKLLLGDLTTYHRFGRVNGMVYVIEFQKRRLPHGHILAFMAPEYKAWEKERIDKFVCAELPHKDTHPKLYETVKSCMIHGPCGPLNPNAPLMDNGNCTKGFPKDFCSETNSNKNGYPKYQCRNDNNFVELGGNRVDNRWVVPYNPYFSLKYNAHINVEICSSIQSVKYLFKYVYKGHDCANIQFVTAATVQEATVAWDEVKNYLETRYVSAPEACWRLREYKMHHQTDHVERLNVHLEDKHIGGEV